MKCTDYSRFSLMDHLLGCPAAIFQNQSHLRTAVSYLIRSRAFCRHSCSNADLETLSSD